MTMVWVVSRFRLKGPPGISFSCIPPLTPSEKRSRASWTSQPQKSATLSPQPGGKTRKFRRTCGGTGEKKLLAIFCVSRKIVHHMKTNITTHAFYTQLYQEM